MRLNLFILIYPFLFKESNVYSVDYHLVSKRTEIDFRHLSFSIDCWLWIFFSFIFSFCWPVPYRLSGLNIHKLSIHLIEILYDFNTLAKLISMDRKKERVRDKLLFITMLNIWLKTMAYIQLSASKHWQREEEEEKNFYKQ